MAKFRPSVGRTYLLNTYHMLDPVQERPGNNIVPKIKHFTAEQIRHQKMNNKEITNYYAESQMSSSDNPELVEERSSWSEAHQTGAQL